MSDDSKALLRFMRGDQDAVNLCLHLAELSHLYDDLIDRDKPIDDATVHRAMWLALSEIPDNPFYQKWFFQLQPLLVSSIINWRIANQLERNQDDLRAREIAHVTRYALADVILAIAYLIGGEGWVEEIGPELRLLCQKDTLAHFMQECKEKYDAQPKTTNP